MELAKPPPFVAHRQQILINYWGHRHHLRWAAILQYSQGKSGQQGLHLVHQNVSGKVGANG